MPVATQTMPRSWGLGRWISPGSALARRLRSGLSGREGITPVVRKPSVDFSLTGLIYCAMMMFMGLAAVNTQANLLFGVFGLMIGVLLVSVTLCRLVLMRLHVTRALPESAVVGQRATVHYHFHNAKRFWPSLSVTVAELDGTEAFTVQPHAYMLHAAPGMTAVVPVELIPKRRGLYRLGEYQISTSFPFGFIKRALVRRKEDPILVYPGLGTVSPRLLALCRSAERSGTHRKPRRGGSDEFYGVKPFRPGENPRWIHWRRSARTGALVVKEMAQISPPSLLILVDTYASGGEPDESAQIEKTIARAASLASRVLDSGMAVGLCVWADGWKTIAPQRGKRHCRDILAALAELPANRRQSLEELVETGKTMMRGDVTMVLCTPRNVQLGFAEQVRGSILVVSGESDLANGWFEFDPAIHFEQCAPLGNSKRTAGG